jgi:hypothetical protein
MIALEEKFISKIKSREPYMMLTEYTQLIGYKSDRWRVMIEIATQHASALADTGLPSGYTPDTESH